MAAACDRDISGVEIERRTNGLPIGVIVGDSVEVGRAFGPMIYWIVVSDTTVAVPRKYNPLEGVWMKCVAPGIVVVDLYDHYYNGYTIIFTHLGTYTISCFQGGSSPNVMVGARRTGARGGYVLDPVSGKAGESFGAKRLEFSERTRVPR